MKNVSISLIALLAYAALYSFTAHNQVDSQRQLYEQWKSENSAFVQIAPEEDEYRFRVFLKNLKEINEHNAKPNETYKMGVNRFTGLSDEEFRSSYLFPMEASPNFK